MTDRNAEQAAGKTATQTKLTVKLAFANDQWEEVPAFETVTPGLVVHRPSLTRGYWSEKTWTVTHAKSGRALGKGFKTRKAALDYAAALGVVCDWTKPRTWYAKKKGLGTKRDALLKQFGGSQW